MWKDGWVNKRWIEEDEEVGVMKEMVLAWNGGAKNSLLQKEGSSFAKSVGI